MGALKIGWAEENITPDRKISLAGQFAERISQYVEKPLTVTAMAIEKDGEQAVIVSCDLGAVAWNLVEAVRERLADNGEGLLFKKGEILRKVPEEALFDELMKEIALL